MKIDALRHSRRGKKKESLLTFNDFLSSTQYNT